MSDHPDTLCQGGGGRTGRTRRPQVSGGNTGRHAPKHTARRKWTWNRKPDFSLGLVKRWMPIKGSLLCTSLSYSRAGWGFGAGGRTAGHLTLQGRGCGQEAAAGAVPKHQSNGREGAAGTCIVQAWLPIRSPRPPARVLSMHGWSAACGFQAGSNWAEKTRSALLFIYSHTFTHSCIHQLFSCCRSW